MAKRYRGDESDDESELKRNKPDEEEEIENNRTKLNSQQQGPLGLLRHAVRANEQIMISCRHNRQLLAKIKAFDRHFNMVLEGVREMWTEIPKVKSGTVPEPVNKLRFINKMFLRGDMVILVVKNPSVPSG